MARLHSVDPATATGKVKELFDGPLKGLHINIFKGMANSPATLEAVVGLNAAVGHSSLSAKEREVIQLTIGEANGCDYCVAAHTVIGTKAGLTQEQTIEARKGSMAEPKLNALVKFVRAIKEKQGHVSDAEVKAFRDAGYNDANIADVVTTYALAVFTNVFNHVNQTAIDFQAPPKIQ